MAGPAPRAESGAGGEGQGSAQPPAVTSLVPVHLVGLPLDLAARSTEYHEGLVRELMIITLDTRHERIIPTGLKQLIDGLRGRLAAFTASPSQDVARAVAEGAATLDVQLNVPAEVADEMAALDRLLDQADDYCRAGEHLLTLAAPTEIKAYRKWLLAQFTTQIMGGAQPLPWADTAAEQAMSTPPQDRSEVHLRPSHIVGLDVEQLEVNLRAIRATAPGIPE